MVKHGHILTAVKAVEHMNDFNGIFIANRGVQKKRLGFIVI